jgi:hypothetical protein
VQALSIDPTYNVALSAHAFVLRTQGRDAEAETSLRRSLEHEETVTALSLLSAILERKAEWSSSTDLLERALQLPEDQSMTPQGVQSRAQMYVRLARLNLRLGKRDRAEDNCRAAAALAEQHRKGSSKVTAGYLDRLSEHVRLELAVEAIEAEAQARLRNHYSPLVAVEEDDDVERKEPSTGFGGATLDRIDSGAHSTFAAVEYNLVMQSPVCLLIKKMFLRSYPQEHRAKVDVTRIALVHNVLLSERYQLVKHQFERKNIHKGANEQWLWHGTDANSLQSIAQQGFNRSFSGKNATLWGKGVYFARNAFYSASPKFAVADKDGVQRMFLARVCVGSCVRGKKDLRVPPMRDAQTRVLHDSVGNQATPASQPSIVVTFHDSQSLPQFVVYFKSSVPASAWAPKPSQKSPAGSSANKANKTRKQTKKDEACTVC